LLTFNKNFRIV